MEDEVLIFATFYYHWCHFYESFRENQFQKLLLFSDLFEAVN